MVKSAAKCSTLSTVIVKYDRHSFVISLRLPAAHIYFFKLADLFFFLFFIPRPHPNPLPDLFLIMSSTLLSSLINKFHRHLLSFSSPSLSPSLSPSFSPSLLSCHHITSHHIPLTFPIIDTFSHRAAWYGISGFISIK